ncbi:MAG: molybdate ABC transporter substrate-binding protein [Bacillota bacterium]|jgi:molybdate transport system substrate-binding protein
MKKLISVIMILLLFLFAGCSNTDVSNESANQANQNHIPAEITVSAAASLTDALEDLVTDFNQQYPNVKVTYNFGSSGSLQQQIEQGAPADVFFSAGQKQMTALKDAGLMLDTSIKNILQNQVVLIMPNDAKAIDSFEKITDASIGKIAVGDPDSVPAGQYAAEVLKSLNLTDIIADKLVFAKDVREVLTWVETKNVDVGVVYATDALISDKVSVVATAPQDSHKAIVYPVGIVKASANQEAAQCFVDFLYSDTAKEIFTQYGFQIVD